MRSHIYLAVRKLVRLLKAGAAGSCGHLLLEVQGDIAELLLDVPHDLSLSGGGEAKQIFPSMRGRIVMTAQLTCSLSR